METNKKYAIRCETEEEAKECGLHSINNFFDDYPQYEIFYNKKWYTIISYQEAKEKWLLEDTILLDSTKWLKPNNNEQLIEETDCRKEFEEILEIVWRLNGKVRLTIKSKMIRMLSKHWKLFEKHLPK